MKFPKPIEFHAYRNPDGSYRLTVKNEVYQQFGGPKGKYAGVVETTIVKCRITATAITESGETVIGETDENMTKEKIAQIRNASFEAMMVAQSMMEGAVNPFQKNVAEALYEAHWANYQLLTERKVIEMLTKEGEK